MNLYLKYMPILYYIQARGLAKCKNKKQVVFKIFSALWNCVWISWPLILYLIISNWFSLKSCFVLCLYIYVYIVFINFYEIGCIYNDYISITKEKNMIIHTKDNPPKNWYINSIILRIFSWIVLLIPLLYVSKTLFFDVTLFMAVLSLVFLIHNKIRIVFYNYVTLFLLRFFKFWIVFTVITRYFWWFTYDNLFLYSFILFIVDFFSLTLDWLNTKMWWDNKMRKWEFILINISVCIILLLLFKDWLFLLYLCIFTLELFLITPLNYLSFKNNSTSRKKT